MTKSAEQGSIAEVGSPVLIAPAAIDGVRPWRWMTGVIAVASAVLLLGNAPTGDDWLGEFPPNRLTQTLRGPVAGWTAATRRLALDRPHAALHAGWKRVRGLRFGSEQPGEKGAAAGD